MENQKRDVEIVVLSDLHLGSYGCHAEELLKYLKSINPKKVILNGDVIDFWQMNKKYWKESHTKILRYFLKLISKNVPVFYITGNHDEVIRKYSNFEMGSFKIVDKLVLNINEKKYWFFHGDVFDVTMNNAKWITKLGSVGYDILIMINRFVNMILESIGKEKISLSKKIKDSVKEAVSFVNDFENLICDIAIKHNYDGVFCGHIHKPIIKEYRNESGKVDYYNSGDWIENLTSLEFNGSDWSMYHFVETELIAKHSNHENENLSLKDLLSKIQTEIILNKS